MGMLNYRLSNNKLLLDCKNEFFKKESNDFSHTVHYDITQGTEFIPVVFVYKRTIKNKHDRNICFIYLTQNLNTLVLIINRNLIVGFKSTIAYML